MASSGKPPLLKHLNRLIRSKSAKWNEIGSALDVSEDFRTSLLQEGAMRSNTSKLESVLSRWLESRCSTVSWDHLIEVLRDIDLNSLADEIVQWLQTDDEAVKLYHWKSSSGSQSHKEIVTVTSTETVAVDDSILSPSSNRTIIELMKATKAVADWSLVVLYLDIPDPDYQRILQDNQTAALRQKAIIMKWLGLGKASWASLASALRESGVDQGEFLANEIAKAHPKQ